MSNVMPKPDAALKDFFKNDEIFAALFNGFLFGGEEKIISTSLEPENTVYSETLDIKGNKEKINRYRDNVRRSTYGHLVILGIEDQDRIHYSMPVRKMIYDALGYGAEISHKGNCQNQKEWTIDERLSRVSKGTKITPIITVVFYTGEDVWDGPLSLYDMMDIDETIKAYVPDYPLYVVDIGHDKTLTFPNKKLEDLRLVLNAIYSGKIDESNIEVDNSTLSLAGILARDKELYYIANNDSMEGTRNMCKALEERDARIFAEKDEMIQNMQSKLDSCESKCSILENELMMKEAEYNARIEVLEKLLSDKQ